MFSSYPATFMSSTDTDKNNPVHDQQISFPNVEPFPNRVLIRLSRNAFPIRVLPEDDRTDSVLEERLGLPYWTMILATCVVVDVSRCLDTMTLKIA